MSSYWNLDGIKVELNKRLDTTESFLKAWENVSFPTKKDGEPFAVMSKNIDGATYKMCNYALQPGEYELTVSVWIKSSGYLGESLQCYKLVKDLDETMKVKTQNYMAKTPYLEQVYCYDLDDIKKAVVGRIEYLKNRIVLINKELEIVDKCFHEFESGYNKLIQELEQNCCAAGTTGFSKNRNDIYYMILDTVLKK